MKSIKGFVAGIVMAIVSSPVLALSMAEEVVFDKWVSGVYTADSNAGAMYVQREGEMVYLVQGDSLIEFTIEEVNIVSPVQSEAIVINPYGGVVTMSIMPGLIEITSPHGDVMTLRHIRGLIKSEREQFKTIASLLAVKAGKTTKQESSMSKVEVSAKPGFDCTKTSTQVEKMICSSDKMANLDAEMAKRYKSLMTLADDQEFFKKDQRQWIAQRNTISSKGGLAKFYEERISELDTILRHMNKPAEFR